MTCAKTAGTVAIFFLLSSFGCAKRVPLPSGNNAASPPGKGLQVMTIDKKEALQQVGDRLPMTKNELIASRIHSEIIYPGDELEMIIYEKLPVSDEKRLERKRVNEAGRIVLQPVGEVEIAGLSVIQAQKTIEDKLQPFIVSPFCEIFITKRRYEPQIYVFGEVQKNGAISFTKGDHFIDALSTAGGCKDDAYRRSVKLIRSEQEKVVIYSINLLEILENGRLDQNIVLQDQDIIFVPRRFYSTFRETMYGLSMVMPWYYLLRVVAPAVVP
ncbi:MAG: polysaccharide export protein [Chitinispirillaceae bacterium]|nr:polysaccharide export protein [Chitinispirillaceae bacterium]